MRYSGGTISIMRRLQAFDRDQWLLRDDSVYDAQDREWNACDGNHAQ